MAGSQINASQEAMTAAINKLDDATAAWVSTVGTKLSSMQDSVNNSEWSGEALKQAIDGVADSFTTLKSNYDAAQKRGDNKISTIKQLLADMDSEFTSEGEKGKKAVNASAEEAATQMPE